MLAVSSLARCARRRKPHVLDGIGVLILVDQHVAEAALILDQHVRMLAKQPETFEQQVTEIAGVQFLQALLILGIERRTLAVGEREGLAFGHLVGRQALVLPRVDERRQLPRAGQRSLSMPLTSMTCFISRN